MWLWLVFFGLFLLSAGVGVVFMVYICVAWYVSLGQPQPYYSKKEAKQGLSATELDMLAGVEDGGLVKGNECAVCLDDIEEGQPARVLPQCRHAFHRHCADSWISLNAVCPLCRAQLLLPPPAPEPQTCDV